MSQATFYSDRTRQPRPRIREEIPANVWRGLVGLIVRRIDDGSLAKEFPLRECPDSSSVITGADRAAFEAALGALIPELRTTSGLPHVEFGLTTLLDPHSTPPTPVALDVIDFVSHHIAEPTSRDPHSWGWQHQHHLFGEESTEQGQEQYRDAVELIFSRNGIAFTIGEDKKTARLGNRKCEPCSANSSPTLATLI